MCVNVWTEKTTQNKKSVGVLLEEKDSSGGTVDCSTLQSCALLLLSSSGGRRDAEDQGSSKAEGSLQIEGRQPLVSMLKKGKNIHEDLSARTPS